MSMTSSTVAAGRCGDDDDAVGPLRERVAVGDSQQRWSVDHDVLVVELRQPAKNSSSACVKSTSAGRDPRPAADRVKPAGRAVDVRLDGARGKRRARSGGREPLFGAAARMSLSPGASGVLKCSCRVGKRRSPEIRSVFCPTRASERARPAATFVLPSPSTELVIKITCWFVAGSRKRMDAWRVWYASLATARRIFGRRPKRRFTNGIPTSSGSPSSRLTSRGLPTRGRAGLVRARR